MASSKATRAISAAIRRILSAEIPTRSVDGIGLNSLDRDMRSAIRWNTGRWVTPPCAVGGRQVGLDTVAGQTGSACQRRCRQTSGLPSASRMSRPCSEDLGSLVDQDGCVGIASQIVKVHLAGAHQVMHEREDEQAVGAWRDADPFVGDCVIARPDRVDADDFCAAGF